MLLVAGCSWIATGNSTPLPPPVTDPPPAIAYETLTAVTAASIPASDQAALTSALRGIDAPPVAQTEPTHYEVGDRELFWFNDLDSGNSRQIEATLQYRSPFLNMWVERGQELDPDLVGRAGRRIESSILPQVHDFFGLEWRPGIDGDDRIHILHLARIGGVGAAQFAPSDEYVTAVNPFSNQRELLYVSLDSLELGSEVYFATIAHEMVHLVQWHRDKNEASWLDEGLAELSAHLIGFDIRRSQDYARQTDIQLNTLSHDPAIINAHYASAALMAVYFYDRFGAEATRALVRHEEDGIEGIEKSLAELDAAFSFDDLFADWLVANYLTSERRGQGIHRYDTMAIPPLVQRRIRRLPATGRESVNQFGADFIRIESELPVTVAFTGTRQIPLHNVEPRSGRYYWGSLPADASNMHLTRPVDLRGVQRATLEFWTWYEIESGWDYAYLAVSGDGGQRWQLLTTEDTTLDDPNGNSFGPGLTGNSGRENDEVPPRWVRQSVDLTPFAGQEILLRFQYVTDARVHYGGILVDDVSIPELGYFDDFETVDPSWVGAGFVRTGSMLPQQYIVQSLLMSADATEVMRLELDERQQGVWTLPFNERVNTAVLIVSGSTPVTRHAAVYEYRITTAR